MPPKNAQKCPEGNTAPSGQNSKSRVRWYPSFTSFLETAPYYDADKVKYLCYGKEVCPDTGREHWQGCVYFFDKVSIKQAQKILQIGNSHVENVMYSDTESCIEYCKKEGQSCEFGVKPAQGRRTDFEALCDDIRTGATTSEGILETNPIMHHQYGRTFDRLEDLMHRKKWRTEMTKGIWYYGKTGKGKTHMAFDGVYDPEKHYILPKDNGWWDNYRGQEIVVINDYRGWLPYDVLLQMVDKWPFDVNRRGRPPMPFTSKTVIITSALSPEEVYCNRHEKDDIEQLLRRFDVIKV